MQKISTPRSAATVVLIRDGDSGLETLLLKRNAALQFAGGVWVFPGGGLETSDWEGTEGKEELAARAAAVREAEEETGLRLSADRLVQISHWTTPETAPKRFYTWFFLTVAPAEPEVLIDGSEIHDHAWMGVEAAIEAHEVGDIGLFPPTIITLMLLRRYATAHQAFEGMKNRTPYKILPVAVKEGAEANILYPGDVAYPSGDLRLKGATHRSIQRGGRWTYIHEMADAEFPRLDI